MLPVVDIFAGPGGLGEGFSQAGFEVVLSVERDNTACSTLSLRKFFNQFRNDTVPDEYYHYITGKISLEDLQNKYPRQWKDATASVLNVELGSPAGNKLVSTKLRSIVEKHKDFILVGGPPCQAYSLAGRSRMLGIGKKSIGLTIDEKKKIETDLAKEFYLDHRHTLYKEYLKILCEFRPACFILENVKGIGSAKLNESDTPGSVFLNLCNGLKNPESIFENELIESDFGYNLFTLSDRDNLDFSGIENLNASNFILRAEEYGIPQSRHRVIVVGIRKDLTVKPNKLKKNPFLLTVGDAISDLPKVRSGLSKEPDTFLNWRDAIVSQVKDALIGKSDFTNQFIQTINEINAMEQPLSRGKPFIKKCMKREKNKANPFLEFVGDDRIEGVIHHETRTHIRKDLLRYFLISNMAKILNRSPKISEWQGDLISVMPNHANVTISGSKLTTGTHKDRFRVQVENKPSSTLVSHISKDGHYFIHPDPLQCRSLTVREAARLQSFPDNYYFFGGRTSQFHQVGNAVPVLLAFKIALEIKNIEGALK